MCFGHQFCLSPDSEDNFSPDLGTQGKSIYGRISDYQTIAKPYGNCQEILTNWSSAAVHAQVIKVTQGCEYTVHGAVGRETIIVVEEGMGEVRFLGKQLALSPLCAIKLGPTGTISFYAKTQLHLFQASMCVSESPSDQQDNIEFCNADSQEWKLYEYEALGQEILPLDIRAQLVFFDLCSLKMQYRFIYTHFLAELSAQFLVRVIPICILTAVR